MKEIRRIALYGELGTGERGENGEFAPGDVDGLRWSSLTRELVDFFVHWWHTRRWRLLPAAMVCVLFLLSSGAVLLIQSHQADQWTMRGRYEAALAKSVNEKDWDAARVVCDSLLSRDPENTQYLFNRCAIAEGQGQHELVSSILARLSPLDGIGVPAARRLLAVRLLQSNQTPVAIAQMRKACEEAPRDIALQIDLGNLLLSQGQEEEGLKILEARCDGNAALHIQLARYYLQRNRTSDAQRHFRLAASLYEHQWRAEGAFQSAWAAAEARRLCGDNSEAQTLLLDALKKFPKEKQLIEELALVYATQAAEAAQKNDRRTQWRFLEQSLKISPANLAALSQVAELTFAEGKVGESAKEIIDQLIADGRMPAAVHLIIGTRAVLAKDESKAELHLTKALENNPQSPVVLNNLAWVMLHKTPPQLEQAEAALDAALQLAPQLADIWDTRALLRIKQGNAKQAISDLETALKLRPNTPGYLKRLAEAYRLAGDEETAKAIEERLLKDDPLKNAPSGEGSQR